MRLVPLATIESTNKEARKHAQRGDRGPLWITAVAQTEGRGRAGRTWYSPPGNLHASLLLFDPSPCERAPELAFVAALALREAIIAEAPALAPALRFKWPNDLLLAGRKCAGILIEGEIDPRMGVAVVIGIGVNCVQCPPTASRHVNGISDKTQPHRYVSGQELLVPATDLRSHGVDITAERLFERLSATMCARIAQWNRGAGLPAILSDWLAVAGGIGETICVRNGRDEKSGRFIGLDQGGRLMLERADGSIETISAGDVFPFASRGGRRRPSRRAE